MSLFIRAYLSQTLIWIIQVLENLFHILCIGSTCFRKLIDTGQPEEQHRLYLYVLGFNILTFEFHILDLSFSFLILVQHLQYSRYLIKF